MVGFGLGCVIIFANSTIECLYELSANEKSRWTKVSHWQLREINGEVYYVRTPNQRQKVDTEASRKSYPVFAPLAPGNVGPFEVIQVSYLCIIYLVIDNFIYNL